MTDIFISYSKKDLPKVNSIITILESFHYNIWWDNSLLPGEDFNERIEEEIRKAKCVIVIWSTSSVKSYWVRAEANIAMEISTYVPIMLEEVSLPLPFAQYQVSKMLSLGEENNGLSQDLLKSISEKVYGKSKNIIPNNKIIQSNDIKTVLKKTLKLIDDKSKETNTTRYQIDGIHTGFVDIDKITFGLHKKELTVIAARPAMGASILALNIASNASNTEQTLYISTYESIETIGCNLYANYAHVDVDRIISGDITEEEWPRMGYATKKLAEESNILIETIPDLSILDIERILNINTDIELIVIDGIEELDHVENFNPRKFIKGLKLIAELYNLSVIVTSRLSSHLENRDNKRPTTRDLTKKYALDFYADFIWFIYIDEVYGFEYDSKSHDHSYSEIYIIDSYQKATKMIQLPAFFQYHKFSNYSDSK